MAGTLPAVAYSMEVQLDRCTVRITTKESRHSKNLPVIHFGKEGAIMELDKDTIFVLSREDVVECAREMGIPEEAITDDVLRMVRKGVDNGLECWSMVMKEAINFALKS
jgi:hypothetical protein